MNLTPNQTNKLLKIIDKNQAMVLGREFGTDFLTDYDRSLLQESGVDLESLYSEATDTAFTSFHFGMLSDSLKEMGLADKTSYNDLYEYISRGEYIPLTHSEIEAINSIKIQSLASLRSVGGKIFQDINQILPDSSRETQEAFIRKEVEEGIRYKKTTREIASEIAHKTGDWSRDFDRIVQYMSQAAFERGKASAMTRQYGEDIFVYKQVYPGACKHCIRLYLTQGLGSKPKTFKLAQLVANGSNIGRKVADWKPTLDPIHPYCRCILQYLSHENNFDWKIDKKKFETTAPPSVAPTRTRPKIKAIVGGKEVWV